MEGGRSSPLPLVPRSCPFLGHLARCGEGGGDNGGGVGSSDYVLFCPVWSEPCLSALPLWGQEPGGSRGYFCPSACTYWGCWRGRALC